MENKRPTIAELEEMLSKENTDVEIAPSGEVFVKEKPCERPSCAALSAKVKALEKVREAALKYHGNGRHAEWCYQQGIHCACGKESVGKALHDSEEG